MATFPTVTTGDLVSAADWNAIQPYVHYAVDFQIAKADSNVNLTTSFQAVISVSYTPPSDWTTYTLKARGFTTVSVSPGTDLLETRMVIDGTAGDVTDDNHPSTTRSLQSAKITSGLSGNVTVGFQVRNETAANGTAYTHWLDMVAKQDT